VSKIKSVSKKNKAASDVAENRAVYYNFLSENLPQSWTITKLNDLCEIKTGKLDVNQADDGGKYPFFTCAEKIYKINSAAFNTEAVLVAGNGFFNVKYYKGKFNAYQRTYVLSDISIDGKYLYYYIDYRLSDITKDNRGSTICYIRLGDLSEYPVAVAPDNEQKRIVEEIEKQFSRLDEAVENLKRVKANLKRYKASVLKACVEGKLTEDWRKANPDVESAGKLLERTLAKRHKNWEEAELAKMKAKGKVPKDDKWKKKYKKPLAPETEGLNKLPDNWTWCSFGQLIQRIKAGKSFKCNERPPNGKEVGVVKVSAVTWGEFNELKSKTVTDKSKVNQDYLIHQGDFLFSRANTIELVGACVIANLFKRKLMLSDKILRLDLTFDLKKWCLVCLRTRFGRNEIESLATGNQESMRNISQANIMKIRLPLPPLEEQYSVINELEQILTQCQMVDKMCNVNLKRADSLRQSILKKAFSGLLV